MFSILQKRQISEKVQMILRTTNHLELPKGEEIQFSLHVDGAESWSWADIKNNGAVSIPSVNPWNEAQATPPNPQHGHEPEPKPLAQYLGEYLDHENKDICMAIRNIKSLYELLQHALDAYESTEGVVIQIIKKKRI